MNVNHGITDTGKLKTIEIDKYEPIPDKPGRCRAVGQASKQEIFDQLKDHLEYVGMLPDEYFIISTQQPEIIPENWRDFTCNVSYGGSEGIYLDISLNTASGSQSFITGKTLSEDVESFLNMSRAAAECNLMLNGNGSVKALPRDIAEYLHAIFVCRGDEEYKQKCLKAQLDLLTGGADETAEATSEADTEEAQPAMNIPENKNQNNAPAGSEEAAHGA